MMVDCKAWNNWKTVMPNRFHVPRIIRGILIIILFLTLLACSEGDNTKSISTESRNTDITPRSVKLYNQGTSKLRKGLYQEAIRLFLAAVKESKGNFDAWDHLGVCYRRTGQIDKAIQVYKTSIEINPKNPFPYGNLGQIYLNRNDFAKALRYYNIVINLNPKDPEGYFGAGTVCEKMKMHDVAIKNYHKAAEQYEKLNSPLLADAYYGLGVNYALKEPPDNEQAVEYFLKAKQLRYRLPLRIENFVDQHTGQQAAIKESTQESGVDGER